MTPSLSRLQQARALITKPEAWTQNMLARDSRGLRVPVDSPEAVCFCARGAIKRVGGTQVEVGWLESRAKDMLEIFNDRHSHEEVLALFDRGIVELQNYLEWKYAL